MTRNGPKDPPVVLVAKDEPLVRMTAADELEEAGFHVLAAANADVALAVLEARSDEVRVLVTDVDMPGSMDGMALAEKVHWRWPHIPLLISSGQARLHPDQIPDRGHFVPKPYIGGRPRPPHPGDNGPAHERSNCTEARLVT